MAITTPVLTAPEPTEGRLVFSGVRWDDYEAMLQIVGERRVRVTYDAGTMEVSRRAQRHEQAAQLLGLFITRLAEELEIPYEPFGMTTWKLPGAEKGIEADQCYHIQRARELREWVRSELLPRQDAQGAPARRSRARNARRGGPPR